MPMSKKKQMSCRKFLTQVAAGGAPSAIVPRPVLGHGFTPPSDTLNIASVGVGAMGRGNLINLASQNIVALCDVDWSYAGKSLDRLETDMVNLRTRIDQGPPPPRPGHPPAEFDRAKATAQFESMPPLKDEHLPRAKR